MLNSFLEKAIPKNFRWLSINLTPSWDGDKVQQEIEYEVRFGEMHKKLFSFDANIQNQG